jgi:hypothetical protein
MAWQPWPKGSEKDLAKYVLPSVAGRVKLSAVRDDVLRLGKRRELLEEIYKALLKYDIRYAREPFDPTLEQQRIRTPAEILKGAGDATCLDLALLFAGVCLGNQLLPLVVVLDGHALVAVSLVIGRDEANAQRRRDEEEDGRWVGEGLLRIGDTLRELVGRGDYLLIECTGLARSETIPATVPEGRGRVGGRMEFARAVDAGREQLDARDREFVFAIDVAMLQDHIKVPPYDPGSDFAAVPAQAPATRSGFVPRPEVLASLKAHLAPTGVLKVVALHGMPGSGKSVMAAAVAADEEWTSAHFPDGVLWASVGLSPDLTSILSGWIQALGGSDLRFTDPGAARYQLQTLLSSRAVLIVIDDVWEATHGSSLVVGGSRCSVLVTSREAAVARACQVPPEDILPMPLSMTKEEARTLLAGGGGRSLPDAVLPIADDVAAEVGRLPLALQLAAAQVADGVPWQEIRDDLEKEMARLETLDLPGADELEDPHLARQQSLLASLAISFRRLPADRRRRLVRLGVVRRDSVVLPAAAAVLWALGEREARDDLRYLSGRGLLDPWGKTGFKLHNTVHALARRLITAPVEPAPEERFGISGLAMTQTAAHAELISRFAATRVNGEWHSLTDDGYIHRNLVWHIERAECLDELHALLQETSAEGANAWFAVREHLGQPEGLLDDVRRAFALSTGEWCIRYALILASLRSLANVPSELVQAMIRTGHWAPSFVVYARNMSDAGARALSLAALADIGRDLHRRELLHEAMVATEALDEDEGDEVISAIAPRLAQAGRVQDALSMARRLQGQPLASVLVDIAAVVLPSERAAIFSEAVEAGAATSPLFRSGALASLAPHLDEAQLRELLLACEEIPGQALRETATAVLLPRLGELGFPVEAVARARSLTKSPARESALASIARSAAEPIRTDVVREVLALLPEIDDEAWAERLAGEVPELPPAARSLLKFSISLESSLAEILASLPRDLAPELRRKALEVIDAREDPLEVARAVAALAPRLGDEEREVTVRRVAERARAELEPGSRAPALAVLVEAYPTQQRAAVAREVLDISDGQFVLDMEDVLRKVGPYLNEADQSRALTSIAREQAESRQSRLAALTPFLSPALLPRAIAIARTIDDDDAALLVGAALAAQLDAEDLRALMDWMPRVANDYVRARAVAAVLPHLTEAALPAAQTVIEGTTRGGALAVALPALATRLTGSEKDATLRNAAVVAAAMDDPYQLVWAFQEFVQQLSDRQRREVVKILDASLVHQREYPECRVQLLAAAAARAGRKLRPSLVARAFALMKQLTDDERRSRALCALAGVLDEGERATAMTHADDIASAFEKAEVYAALAATALEPQNAHDMAILAVQQGEHFVESQVLSTSEQAEIIASRALPYVSPSTQKEVLDLIASFEDRALSARALADITPRLGSELLPRAIEIAASYQATDRTAPLVALAARTTNASRVTLLGQALDSALEEHTDLLNDDTLAPIAQPLAELPLAELTPIWRRALNAIADRPRPTALASLRSLAPVLLRVEGQNGARHCFRALGDVRQWWP